MASTHLALDCPPPTADRRFMVLAPHPDDETLACAGLIKQAAASGAAVRVLFITNGDGFRAAAGRHYRKLGISPAEYVKFGEYRRSEAIAAMRELGLRADDLRFAGMPDGVLMRLWRTNWSNMMALPSQTTGTSVVPYGWAVRPGAVFSGSSLLEIVRQEIEEFEPTDVILPHPADDHGDHAAVSAFTQMAVAVARAGGTDPHAPFRLHYWLIHRGDWPQPQGLRPDAALAPPAEMFGLDTEWHGLRLSRDDVLAKLRAVKAYRSQTTIARRFLMSFVRTTEFLGAIPDAMVAQSPMTLLHDLVAPAAMKPIALDAVDDNIIRRAQPYADIRVVEAAADAANFHIRVETVGRPSALAQMRLCLRYLGDPERGTMSGAINVSLRGRASTIPPGVRVSRDATATLFEVPLRALGHAKTAFLDVETSVAGVIVDRIGARTIRLEGER